MTRCLRKQNKLFITQSSANRYGWFVMMVRYMGDGCRGSIVFPEEYEMGGWRFCAIKMGKVLALSDGEGNKV